ncbi:hypothetical protein EN788_22225 [Mesorhizobium sp. M2D.F.Ca.ET.145.01.1.1]|uniref:HNH endonuclease n=1 Tax=unclassified Mesorhizobium TaxID=325217 RepID=UPI000FCA8353|nr:MULTISPECIES: HNH endonuclease [unclassified Mesorhizobium]TGU44636.1 hypothetical protein EN789_21775 [bacterium M00.F.Ca.ET.146.01.1.1]TGU58464.1 hypothetical protein EN791_021775 [Mesorhizobium sp. M2D.F.Ca.ET.148.01.1.1]TGU64396.1 hypothetical protein EN790_21770 [Mesorhizobium sp. M2D.F.Ca.ET.147.01.1.1]TGW09972.1 hypothetical protein EN788_22225 [Mesorhizobium sp. M2D.F.Ca.ET.145.01.1.1]
MNGEPARFFDNVICNYQADDCLRWPFSGNGVGYGKLYYDGKNQYAHRLACQVRNGPAPTPGHEVAHSCGNGHLGCVNPNHLSWKTHTENLADKIAHGTTRRGANSNLSKLTEDEVRMIRKLASFESQKSIAQRFGVDPSAISHIVRRKHWAWLD